jgi:hypothetical protein
LVIVKVTISWSWVADDGETDILRGGRDGQKARSLTSERESLHTANGAADGQGPGSSGGAEALRLA